MRIQEVALLIQYAACDSQPDQQGCLPGSAVAGVML